MSKSRFDLLNGIPLPVNKSHFQRVKRSKREDPMFALKNGGQFHFTFLSTNIIFNSFEMNMKDFASLKLNRNSEHSLKGKSAQIRCALLW